MVPAPTARSPPRLFLVIEYVNGGDLMFHMQRQRKLPEEHARWVPGGGRGPRRGGRGTAGGQQRAGEVWGQREPRPPPRGQMPGPLGGGREAGVPWDGAALVPPCPFPKRGDGL